MGERLVANNDNSSLNGWRLFAFGVGATDQHVVIEAAARNSGSVKRSGSG